MKILHYALGFPPYRTGGLTKYCIDLMLEQRKQDMVVAMLWPGRMSVLIKETGIKKRNSWKGIENYELMNPLPVPLDEGIKDVGAYTKSVDRAVYYDFLKNYSPDIIHIHTLMGLHKEFFDAARDLHIRTVYTSHDYFGICPKVTLYHDNKVCDNDHNCADCVRCNQTALSLKKIMLLQSSLYCRIKNTRFIKLLRKWHRENFFYDLEENFDIKNNGNIKADDYRTLRRYYISILESVDTIHFNSNVSKEVYQKYVQPQKSAVLSITHGDIKDHRHIKNFNHDKLKITYLGPAKPFKGFQFLISTLDELWTGGTQSFELHLYTETAIEREYITHKQAGYPYSQLEDIFEDTDLLVTPSQCYETFGFTVLEALSYGVPVLVSENVGAKDILQTDCIANNEAFKKKLFGYIINRFALEQSNKLINTKKKWDDIAEHSHRVTMDFYRGKG